MPSKWVFKEAEFTAGNDGSGGAAAVTVTEANAGFPLDDVWAAHTFAFDMDDNPSSSTAKVNVQVMAPGGTFITVAHGIETDEIVCINQYFSVAGKAHSSGNRVQNVPVAGFRTRAFRFIFTDTSDGAKIFMRSDISRGY